MAPQEMKAVGGQLETARAELIVVVSSLTEEQARSNRRTAPEAVHPTGKYGSISEALREFNAARDETLRFASEQGVNLLSRRASHPVLGALNGVEALLLIAGHGKRHTAQMREAAEGR